MLIIKRKVNVIKLVVNCIKIFDNKNKFLCHKELQNSESVKTLNRYFSTSITTNSAFNKNFYKIYPNKKMSNTATGTAEVENTTTTSKVTYLDIPEKSENDKKLYKTLLLSNGIRALLVSDPSPVPHDGLTTSSGSSGDESKADSCNDETSSTSTSLSTTTSEGNEGASMFSDESEEGDEKLAACAVLVDVGSFTEPEAYQGLAHFLEHMIFMGSKKYPEENAFDAHIKKCGGFDNANTECEETCYYFEVSEQYLDSSMDYFAALFEDPLMKKDAMTRERDAVESEFQQTLHDDEARRDQLLASLATNTFPHSTFSWGNLKSLKENVNDDDLHKMLHQFRERHYSANRMIVCVQARLPIDELEEMVLKNFSRIPNNKKSGRDFDVFKYNEAFTEDFYKVFFVKPVENVCKLELTWVLPPMMKHYRCKPDHFMSYLFGYEGEGSLCAYLRKKLWGLDLMSGVDDSGFDSNSMYTLFNLCIFLTEEGFKHLDEVLGATFAFVKLFAETDTLKEAYTELQQIEAISFRFESQKPAFDNVQNLVGQMKHYPPKDILTGNALYFEYNEKLVKEVIQHINQFRFNLMITSQQKYDGITYDKKEKWFGTEYTVMDMPQKWRDLWDNSKPIEELFMPKLNKFITNDFKLFWEENGKPELSPAPKKLLQTDICELWFRQDDKFHLPDAYMHFYFVSPIVRQSPKKSVLCALFVQAVKYALVEELYPATVAGLDYSIYSADRGIVVKVSGYNEKLDILVAIIVKTLVSIGCMITEEQFEVFKTQQKRLFFNTLIKPKHLNKDIRLCLTEHIRWPMIDKYKCLKDIHLSDLQDFSVMFLNELYVQTLMQGNLTEETAHNVMNSILSTINCQPIKDRKYIENRTVQLPQGAHYIRCHALNEQDANTLITNFYQIGPCSLRIESILDLLMMFVEEPLFDTLRTKEQLGYYVGCSVRMNFSITGYSITVNSQENKFDAAHVEERIEAFRGKMLSILNDMDDADFQHVKESLIKIKQVVDMSLGEEVGRNWGEITCEEYVFDRRRREIEVIRTLSKQDILDFCLNNERTNFRKLSVQVIGNKDVKPLPDSEVETDDEAETNANAKKCSANTTTDGTDDADDMDIDDEELFTNLADRLDVIFIPRDGDATAIVDIQDFKENLHVYPITKTKLDSCSPNERRNNSPPPLELIEDC